MSGPGHRPEPHPAAARPFKVPPEGNNSRLAKSGKACDIGSVRSAFKQFERLMDQARAWARQHWQRALRIRDKVRISEEAFHLILAGCVGVIGGFVNVVFHKCIDLSEMVFLGRVGEPEDLAAASTWWQKLFVPTIGGAAAGLVLYLGLRFTGKKRSSNILEAVATSDGRLPFRASLVKSLSSLVTIGSGGSIGKEGAITDLAAVLASKWGQLAHWQPYRLRLLTACGAASGISAAYNAPVAGAVFAAWIVLGNFSMNLFAPLVFSSVVAAMVSRSFFGLDPLYTVPPFHFARLVQLPWFLILGVAAGIMGALFLKLLHACQELFRKMPVPIYVRLMIGGLAVGVLTLGYPGVWGNGFGVTNQILHQEFLQEKYPLAILAGLFAAKLLATLATVGSGAVGGVFTPTLFLGAGLGAMLGVGLHETGHGLDLPTGAFALVGMGSMLSATTRSPLLAMIMAFEISLNYSVMPPLMLACVISTLVARRLHPESIYTQPLRDKGLALDRDNVRPGSATEQTVGDLMHAPVPPLREKTTLPEMADRFLTSPNNFLPVVDARDRLIGIVALQDLKEHLNAGAELSAVIAYDVMRPPPAVVTPDQLLLDTLPVMLASEQRNVPVVNSRSENRLVGALGRSEVLGMLSEAIALRTNPGQSPATSALNEDKKNGEAAKDSGD
jgi:CIC family chloride channel protein